MEQSFYSACVREGEGEEEGEEVDLGLLIHRQGGQDVLQNVTTRFYLGDPNNGGTLIGEAVIKFFSPRSTKSKSLDIAMLSFA